MFGLGMLPSDPEMARFMGQRVLEFDNAQKALGDPNMRLKPEWLLNAVRLIQLSLGDLSAADVKGHVWAGYSPARPLPADCFPELRRAIREALATEDHNLDRELTRT